MPSYFLFHCIFSPLHKCICYLKSSQCAPEKEQTEVNKSLHVLVLTATLLKVYLTALYCRNFLNRLASRGCKSIVSVTKPVSSWQKQVEKA